MWFADFIIHIIFKQQYDWYTDSVSALHLQEAEKGYLLLPVL